MRVTVSGGEGFLGRYVNEAATEAGHEVIALSSRDFDLRNESEAHKAVCETRPDAIVHVAAKVGGIGLNVRAPATLFYENAIMGIHLLEAAREAGVPKFVTVGTACSYPAALPVPHAEVDLWEGYPAEATAPYALAKKMLLVMGQAYRVQYGMECEYAIPANLYGPHDHFDEMDGHVIPAVISKISRASRENTSVVVLWGDGTSTRDFLHARDAARGVVMLLEPDTPTYGKPVNFGSGREVSIRELAGMVAEIYRFRGTILWDKSRPSGQDRRLLDTSRAWLRLGWAAKTSLEDGLHETIDWYEQQIL